MKRNRNNLRNVFYELDEIFYLKKDRDIPGGPLIMQISRNMHFIKKI